jgi:WD40 repeat protein
VKVWDATTGNEKATLKRTEEGQTVRVITFSPDSKTMVCAGEPGVIRCWDTAEWKERAVVQAHKVAISALAFSPDGRILASGGWDDTVKLWDVATLTSAGK